MYAQPKHFMLDDRSITLEMAAAESEPNNTKELANNIGIGSLSFVTATISPKLDQDWFKFTAQTGQSYVIETFNVAKAINPNGYALQLHVYDSSNSEIASDTSINSNGIANANASVEFQASSTGEYFVLVDPYPSSSDVGPYSIRLLPQSDQPQANWDSSHEPNNWRTHAYKLDIGAKKAVVSSIEVRNPSYMTEREDRDWFRFDATKDQTYVVETFNVAKAINPNGYAMQLEVYDSDGSNVASDTSVVSDGAGNTNASVQFPATKGGTYFVYVAPYASGAGSGPYSIRVLPNFDQPDASWDVLQEPNNWRSHAFRLNVGRANAIQSTIEALNSTYITDREDRDWFRFDAVAGQKYVIETFDVANAIGPNGYAFQLEVFDRDGSKVAFDTSVDSNGAGNTNSGVEFVATKGGTYFIYISPYPTGANESGSYHIRVLPAYDQPQASWDVGMEPNNYSTIAFPLDVDPCSRTANVIERNSAY
ncbi:MAG: hypothetical protein HC853_12775 [Anaerolineae bacterium]|nr:hypothetical protein [Anaerolineae bacterium]